MAHLQINATPDQANQAPQPIIPPSPSGNSQNLPPPSLKFSSVSSDDSLPLGCEHKEYFWIKRYRALKRKVIDKKNPMTMNNEAHSIKEEDEEGLDDDYPSPTLRFMPTNAETQNRNSVLESLGNANLNSGAQDPNASGATANLRGSGLMKRNMPCTRFYLEERDDDFYGHIHSVLSEPEAQIATEMHNTTLGIQPKRAMLRTQQTLVVSPIQSRWFVVDVVKPMRLLIGATTESGDNGLLARLQPANCANMKIVPVDCLNRGDRVKLLVTPSVSYQNANAPTRSGGGNFCLKGDLTVFVNDQSYAKIGDHEFTGNENIYGLCVWTGSLTDVKLIEY